MSTAKKRIFWMCFSLAVLATLGVGAAEHRLTLVNLDWDRVIVEVREGAQASCKDRPSLGQKTLAKGQSWTNLPCGRPCWRKKLPSADWGPWISTTCFFEPETHEIN